MSANLTAIYNLKFYRKQDCWKLNTPNRKEKELKEKLSTSLRIKLNETYLISNNEQDESQETHPLNVAFIEPEKETPHFKKEVCDLKKDLSQQWLEPVNIWPETVTTSEKNIDSDETDNQQIINKKLSVHERLEQLRAAKEQESTNSELVLDIAQDDIPENYDFNLEEEYVVENDWVPPELCQTVRSEPWINPINVWLDHDVIDGNLKRARPDGDYDSALFMHRSFHPQSTTSLNELDADVALESSTEFMRGAHSAPHSSEVDIALPPEFMFGSLSPNILDKLNPRQFAHISPKHSEIFVKMITSKGNMPERSFTSDLGSYDKYPTRDIGLFPDEFVAGSHLRSSTPAHIFGRGRGRLLQNRQLY